MHILVRNSKKVVKKVVKKTTGEVVKAAKKARIMDPKLAERANAAALVKEYIMKHQPQDVVAQISDLSLKDLAGNGIWSFKGTFVRKPMWRGAEPALGTRYTFKGIVDTVQQEISGFSSKLAGYVSLR